MVDGPVPWSCVMLRSLLQVLMGAAAARLVMVENIDDEGKPLDSKPAPAGSVALPILALLGITVARAAGTLCPLLQGHPVLMLCVFG